MVTLPPRLDFEENYEVTASHFRIIRGAALGRYPIKNLRFEQLRYISPAAALVLASEVDRWKLQAPRVRAATETWDPDIMRLLVEMGLFELLNLPKPTTPAAPGRVRFLRFLQGTSEPHDKGKLAQKLRIDIETIVGKGAVRKAVLFESLSEAITNVIHHAYPHADHDTASKPWWLSASFDTRLRRLTVLIFDQGVGIPATLPARWANFEHIREFFNIWSDAEKIQAAATYGRSSTNRPERGKGLQNLQHFAASHADGMLSIYSSRGLFRLSHGRDGRVEMGIRNHNVSIGGTLIEWAVRL